MSALRRLLRKLAFNRSWSLAVRANAAARVGDHRSAARLKYRAAVWFSRELLCAGLNSWAAHRADVAKARADFNRRRAPPSPDGAERGGGAFSPLAPPLRSPFRLGGGP